MDATCDWERASLPALDVAECTRADRKDSCPAKPLARRGARVDVLAAQRRHHVAGRRQPPESRSYPAPSRAAATCYARSARATTTAPRHDDELTLRVPLLGSRREICRACQTTQFADEQAVPGTGVVPALGLRAFRSLSCSTVSCLPDLARRAPGATAGLPHYCPVKSRRAATG